MLPRLTLGRLSGLLLLALWLPATSTRANDCQEVPAIGAAPQNAAAPGRQFLGQGVALFDAKNLKMAERALQSALFTGLPDPQERVLAHKYLAFVFCSNGEAARCESEFDAAFLVRPSFSLDAYEIQNTPWRDSFRRSQARWAAHCAKQVPSGQTGPNAVGFALNSTVIVAISPLMPAVGGPGSPLIQASVRAPLPHSNVHLRVSPWAKIQVDGKRYGVTPPMTQFNLPEGTRTIELSNPGFETVKRVVRVVDGSTVTITHDFDAR